MKIKAISATQAQRARAAATAVGNYTRILPSIVGELCIGFVFVADERARGLITLQDLIDVDEGIPYEG